MATSGCPVLGYFRPMARFHLPFGSPKEHFMRTLGFYFIREWITSQKGGKGRLDLAKLKIQYEAAAETNACFSQRISEVSVNDADRSAVVGLHTIGMMVGSDLESDFSGIEGYF